MAPDVVDSLIKTWFEEERENKPRNDGAGASRVASTILHTI